jgi:hypothetical protein
LPPRRSSLFAPKDDPEDADDDRNDDEQDDTKLTSPSLVSDCGEDLKSELGSEGVNKSWHSQSKLLTIMKVFAQMRP